MGHRSAALGVIVAAGSLAVTTALLYPLENVADAVSLGVLYLLPVLLVSTVWGLWLGLATSVAAALAFNFFHIPPTGRFTIDEAENWVALAVFLVAAAVASTLSELAGARAREAERRRREADLAAELARLLLGTPDPRAALPGSTACRVTSAARRSRSASTGRCSCRRPPRTWPGSGWRRPSRRCSPPRWSASGSRARSSRRARCGAATRSRPRSCGRSRTTCARR
jgi:Domain of unknown function (DUF4118)